jgi:hypothetical protein
VVMLQTGRRCRWADADGRATRLPLLKAVACDQRSFQCCQITCCGVAMCQARLQPRAGIGSTWCIASDLVEYRGNLGRGRGDTGRVGGGGWQHSPATLQRGQRRCEKSWWTSSKIYAAV